MSKPRMTPKRMTPERLEKIALYYLERYSASAASLRAVLLRRIRRAADDEGEGAETGVVWIDPLIEKLARLGYLDDRRFASSRARTLLARGAPLSTIGRKLAEKGVPGDLVEETLKALSDEAEEEGRNLDLEAARRFAKKRRLGPWREEERREAFRQKDLAALGRAGFSWDIARQAISREEN